MGRGGKREVRETTVRSERSQDSGNAAPSQGERTADHAKAYSIGWGLDCGEEQEGIGMRRAVFFASAAVVCLMGAWFLLTTVTSGNQGRHALSAPKSATSETSAFTIKLLEVEASRASWAKATDVASRPAVKSLAGTNEFRRVDLPNGHAALCVGRFERRESPELRDLLAKFQQYKERGTKVFPDAVVVSLAK
jgi:hypothetical protein